MFRALYQELVQLQNCIVFSCHNIYHDTRLSLVILCISYMADIVDPATLGCSLPVERNSGSLSLGEGLGETRKQHEVTILMFFFFKSFARASIECNERFMCRGGDENVLKVPLFV